MRKTFRGCIQAKMVTIVILIFRGSQMNFEKENDTDLEKTARKYKRLLDIDKYKKQRNKME